MNNGRTEVVFMNVNRDYIVDDDDVTVELGLSHRARGARWGSKWNMWEKEGEQEWNAARLTPHEKSP